MLLSILILPIGISTISAILDTNIPAMVINGIIILFLAHLYTTTYYIIKDDKLTIRASFLIRNQIDIRRIKKVVKTKSLLSSPALSLNRLMIKTETGPYIISPKKKEQMAFISHLLSINSSIETDITK